MTKLIIAWENKSFISRWKFQVFLKDIMHEESDPWKNKT